MKLLIFILTSILIAPISANPTDDSSQMQALNEQALTLHGQGKLAEAAMLYEQVLPLVEKHFGISSEEVARILASLADTHLVRRQYQEAETLFRRALAIYEEKGSDTQARANVLNGLASTFYMRRQYSKAEPLYKEALGLLEQTPGSNAQSLLLVLDNLAALYQTTRRTTLADELRRRAESVDQSSDLAL